MRNPYMTGEKVYLRGIEKEDITGGMANWANDPEITHYMVMGAVPNGGVLYCSWDSPEVEYERMINSKHDVIFAITDKKTDHLIGIIGLYEISWIGRNAELRIVIGEKKFLGKGYGAEATKLVLKYGFEKLNLHKVRLGVNASDERANQCYKKVGFVYEGTMRDYHFRNGRYYNANLYSILEDEFYSKPKERNKK